MTDKIEETASVQSRSIIGVHNGILPDDLFDLMQPSEGVMKMTDKIEEIRRALEVYESDFAIDADLIELAPDMARIVLEQAEEIELLRKRVEAADRLAASIDSDMGKLAFSWETVQSLIAYRATEEEERR